MSTDHRPTRRVLFHGALGCTVLALASCGSAETDQPTDAATDGADAGSDSGSVNLGKAADIPVGGGAVFPDQKIVVTQPTAGKFVAFSALCTHQGVVVNEVSDGTINCPAHGSRFGVSDGAPVAGPANRALTQVTITVNDGEIVATL